MSLFVALSLAASSVSSGGTASPPPAAVEKSPVARAIEYINGGQPSLAQPLLDEAIADFEKRIPGTPGETVFSTKSTALRLVYLGMAAKENRAASVVDGEWAQAYYFKGYSMIDMGRPNDAMAWLEKAIALSPLDAQFLGERAEWYKSNRRWADAYVGFEAARNAAKLNDEDVRVAREGRALRGMAFVDVELGKFDEAEKILAEALKLNPDDQRAKAELQYIAGNR